MIKAKITVFDDETGHAFEKDRVIEPYRQETSIRSGFDYSIEDIEFRFEVHRIKDGHSCINCKHFNSNKPMLYGDNRVTEYCTLHPDEEDACGYCDDYERGI